MHFIEQNSQYAYSLYLIFLLLNFQLYTKISAYKFKIQNIHSNFIIAKIIFNTYLLICDNHLDFNYSIHTQILSIQNYKSYYQINYIYKIQAHKNYFILTNIFLTMKINDINTYNQKSLSNSKIKDQKQTQRYNFNQHTSLTNSMNSNSNNRVQTPKQSNGLQNKMDFEQYIKLQYQQLISENESLKNKYEMIESSAKFLNEKINLKDRQIYRLNEEGKQRQKILNELTRKYRNIKNNFKQFQSIKQYGNSNKQDTNRQQFNEKYLQIGKLQQKNEMQAIIKQYQQKNNNLQKQLLQVNQNLEYFKSEANKYFKKDKQNLQLIEQLNTKLTQYEKDKQKIMQKYQKQKVDWVINLQQKNKKIQIHLKQIQQLKTKLYNLTQQLLIQSEKIKSYGNQINQIQNQHRIQKAALQTQIRYFRQKSNTISNQNSHQNLYSGLSKSYNKFQVLQSFHSQLQSQKTSPKKYKNNTNVKSAKKPMMQTPINKTHNKLNYDSPMQQKQNIKRKAGGIKNYKASKNIWQNNENKVLNKYSMNKV